MAHKLRRKSVSSTLEKRILTSLIVSTRFNYEVAPLINQDYFTNSFIRKVVNWCIDFFNAYEKAPFNHIQDIFEEHRNNLSEEEAELIEKILLDISKKYELDSGLNVDYSIQQALDYFKRRELEITHGNIGLLLEKNDIDGAEDQINTYTKVSRLTSGWINPFDEEHIDEVFAKSGRMFNFPGELGNFFSGIDRGWLVAIVAPFKKGKSAALQEITVPAILNGLKVVHFSLEMGKKESNDRLYKRMMGAGSPEGGPALYPCFDCTKNQDGTCKRKERANRIKLIGADGKPKFTQNLKYKPCTACRFENPTEYDVAWWYELIDRPAYTIENVKKNIAAINRVLNNRYRFKAYPKFSATLDDMKRDLDILERSEGFVPDIIEIDQANGIRPDQGVSTDGIAPHLSAWRGMASLAGERHAMVVSPSQVVRSALDKKSVKQNEVAQWVGLLGDIDIGYSLNQTEDEKREGIMRYNILIHRHDDFDPSASCIVLQKLRFGQAYLDGYIIGKSNYDNTNSLTL